MAHCISAVILRGPFDAAKAAEFNLQPVPLAQDLTLFPLTYGYCDLWATKLSLEGLLSERPLLNMPIVHHIINSIATQPLFAVIETDYFGGTGDQAAAVYHGARQIMPPTVAEFGPINQALRHLGARATKPYDEFDTLGLQRFRMFDDSDPEHPRLQSRPKRSDAPPKRSFLHRLQKWLWR